ncbi:MAG: GNAT family N-acetyltransferase [Chloroflexota bacterium]|nr:GNAT family N-acetyltransferase [Chloroflexota bacterium]
MITIVNHSDRSTATQLFTLQQASYTLESQLIDYPALPPLHETPEEIRRSPETFLVYQEDSHILGALSFTSSPSTVEIGRLVVSPKHLRRGIARALLTAVEQHAPQPGLILVSTAEKNVPAVTLYQQHGYQLIDRRTLPDGLVLVRFQKQIE